MYRLFPYISNAIRNIPEYIGFPILLYIHGELTSEQHDELDRRIEVSQENVDLFAVATDEDHIRKQLRSLFTAIRK